MRRVESSFLQTRYREWVSEWSSFLITQLKEWNLYRFVLLLTHVWRLSHGRLCQVGSISGSPRFSEPLLPLPSRVKTHKSPFNCVQQQYLRFQSSVKGIEFLPFFFLFTSPCLFFSFWRRRMSRKRERRRRRRKKRKRSKKVFVFFLSFFLFISLSFF